MLVLMYDLPTVWPPHSSIWPYKRHHPCLRPLLEICFRTIALTRSCASPAQGRRFVIDPRISPLFPLRRVWTQRVATILLCSFETVPRLLLLVPVKALENDDTVPQVRIDTSLSLLVKISIFALCETFRRSTGIRLRTTFTPGFPKTPYSASTYELGRQLWHLKKRQHTAASILHVQISLKWQVAKMGSGDW
ncbi:hypothetical protein SCHPADRAFT_211896 [Schizopora paradoxa]|uniref:Uncharacterized protein n=1 Tax=Schizopora paradoxa TaxID=27342 RepID=A0A0H2RWY0_9AGAM|nr:hypothetical protein SCHPADRAFT_211896 [Schizopora paradoxa]